MKRVYLIISIDTECDKSKDWSVPQPLSFRNITAQKDVLLPLFKKFDLKPTYLLSPEVILDDESCLFFKSRQKEIELGTHLHAEYIWPNADFKANKTEKTQILLKPNIEFEKLSNLTQLFENKFGTNPKSFRSGRFGSSKQTELFLSQLGYLVDSSVVPYTHKKFGNETINSWNKSVKPYWVQNGKYKILQVPLTFINQDVLRVPNWLKYQLGLNDGFIRKCYKKLGFDLRGQWLRPMKSSSKQMIAISDFTINRIFAKEDFAILNLMFHSNEILPQASPYCQTKQDVNLFINSLSDLFTHLNSNYELCSIGLSESYDIYGPK